MKKILVIEDDYNVRSSIRELLTANNYQVFSASDGKEGVQLAKHIKPDLVLCDIMMPEFDGFKVLENLKQEELFNSVPFIFLTAKAEINDFRTGMEHGADDYITKPYRAADLLKAIQIRLERFNEIQNSSSLHKQEEEKEQINETDTLFVNEKDKPRILKVAEILWIKAQGEYTLVNSINEKSYIIRKLIKTWEKQLPANIFIRIHRSVIININYVDKIEKWSNRSLLILLKHSNEKFIVSQRYSQKIKNKLFV